MDAPHSERARWFAEEVVPHHQRLKAYLRGSFPVVRDVDDVVQESFLRVWRVRATGPILSARALLYTVARRLALDIVRRLQASPVAAVDDVAAIPVADESTSVTEEAGRRERVALLGEAIASLPPRCREVFMLHKIQGLSRRETAERLGLSERTVETQVARAMERCARFLRGRGVTSLYDNAAA